MDEGKALRGEKRVDRSNKCLSHWRSSQPAPQSRARVAGEGSRVGGKRGHTTSTAAAVAFFTLACSLGSARRAQEE